MKKHIAIVADWYGPYGLVEAMEVAANDFNDGMYMLIGKKKYQKSGPKLQYVGIAAQLYDRIWPRHHAISELPSGVRIWLGEIATVGIPGKKEKVTDTQLDLAEWALVYFLELPLNTKKKRNPPFRPLTLLNRWWFKDYETPRKRRPHPDWPDVIGFAGYDYGAKVGWLGGKIERWSQKDFY